MDEVSWIYIRVVGSFKAHLDVCVVSSAVTEMETVRISAAHGANGKSPTECPMVTQCFESESNRPKRAL